MSVGVCIKDKTSCAVSVDAYGIGSMTKAMISAALGLLELLPEFRKDETIGACAITIADLVSHHTGFPPNLSLGFQGDGESLLSKDQVLPTVNAMRQVRPLRSQWIYCRWGYSVTGTIIERLSGQSLREFLRSTLFRPLGMKNATNAATDRSPVLKQMPTILSTQAPMFTSSLRERSYAFGWVRSQLPGVLGSGSPSLLALSHSGSTVGYFSSIFIFSGIDVAAVVLTNSMALNDGADWIAQAAHNRVLQYEQMHADLEKGRNTSSRPAKPPHAYQGLYVNAIGNFCIRISPHPDKQGLLRLTFQESFLQSYDLRPYCGDVFEWLLSLDGTVCRGRYHIWDLEYFKFAFLCDEKSGQVSSLRWVDDSGWSPEGQIFMRLEDEATHSI
ncbi:beta-lactamase/transpeptidase-like protein [Podospora didyma]|uniref:Beta-lactamase/transpeptidase-like protein n=1 Tax=Podospora didyma TaxID=330526 RepID=A0AAE0NI56_9PEZI|nr:beta-lactamase/transpeptidase-like protein [Podospora didyma]